MRKQLCFVHWMECVFAFQFDNYSFLHHQIGTKAAVKLDVVIYEWYGALSFDS